MYPRFIGSDFGDTGTQEIRGKEVELGRGGVGGGGRGGRGQSSVPSVRSSGGLEYYGLGLGSGGGEVRMKKG